MADEPTTANPEGVARTADGTLADQTTQTEQSSQTTSPAESTTQTQKTTDKTEGKTLLTEGKKEPLERPVTKAAPEAPKEGVPEKYEDYKVPEGYTLDAEVKKDADALFKGLGLNQEQAQSLVDFYTAKTTEAFQAPFEAYQKVTDGWKTESENHADLKGKIGPGKEISIRISKFIDGIGDPQLAKDFREHMDITGAGNHQAFIRVLNYAAERLTEGQHVAGKGPSEAGQSRPGQAPKSAAQSMYPNLPSINDQR